MTGNAPNWEEIFAEEERQRLAKKQAVLKAKHKNHDQKRKDDPKWKEQKALSVQRNRFKARLEAVGEMSEKGTSGTKRPSETLGDHVIALVHRRETHRQKRWHDLVESNKKVEEANQRLHVANQELLATAKRTEKQEEVEMQAVVEYMLKVKSYDATSTLVSTPVPVAGIDTPKSLIHSPGIKTPISKKTKPRRLTFTSVSTMSCIDEDEDDDGGRVVVVQPSSVSAINQVLFVTLPSKGLEAQHVEAFELAFHVQGITSVGDCTCLLTDGKVLPFVYRSKTRTLGTNKLETGTTTNILDIPSTDCIIKIDSNGSTLLAVGQMSLYAFEYKGGGKFTNLQTFQMDVGSMCALLTDSAVVGFSDKISNRTYAATIRKFDIKTGSVSTLNRTSLAKSRVGANIEACNGTMVVLGFAKKKGKTYGKLFWEDENGQLKACKYFNDGVVKSIATNSKDCYVRTEHGSVCHSSSRSLDQWEEFNLAKTATEITAGDDFCVASTDEGNIFMLVKNTGKSSGDDDATHIIHDYDLSTLYSGIDKVVCMSASDHAAIVATVKPPIEKANEIKMLESTVTEA